MESGGTFVMKIFDIFRNEHEIIRRKLADAEREATFIRETGKVHRDLLKQFLDFCGGFIEGHQAREEKYLFSKMEERTKEEYDPVIVMLAEHDLCRKMLKLMAEILPGTEDAGGIKAGINPEHKDSEFCCGVTPQSSADMLLDNLSTYIKLLRKHTQREDEIIFPLGERVLTPEELDEIESF
jgi:hemerythrin-like domain-containing protein